MKPKASSSGACARRSSAGGLASAFGPGQKTIAARGPDPACAGARRGETRAPEPAIRAAYIDVRAMNRNVVKFTFLKVDPAWRRLPVAERETHKREFQAACDNFAADRFLRAYSLVGTRGDADLMLWTAAPGLADIHEFHVVLGQSGLLAWAQTPYSYLAMTKESEYSEEDRLEVRAGKHKYLFVYPFEKKREWYRLPAEERKRIMREHITIGRRYPQISINTTYSFGLDDQEFVVSFECDDPATSWTSCTSCAPASRAPTPCATRRSSPASRAASGMPWTHSTARGPLLRAPTGTGSRRPLPSIHPDHCHP